MNSHRIPLGRKIKNSVSTSSMQVWVEYARFAMIASILFPEMKKHSHILFIRPETTDFAYFSICAGSQGSWRWLE